jgi:hypothetical protein
MIHKFSTLSKRKWNFIEVVYHVRSCVVVVTRCSIDVATVNLCGFGNRTRVHMNLIELCAIGVTITGLHKDTVRVSTISNIENLMEKIDCVIVKCVLVTMVTSARCVTLQILRVCIVFIQNVGIRNSWC